MEREEEEEKREAVLSVGRLLELEICFEAPRAGK